MSAMLVKIVKVVGTDGPYHHNFPFNRLSGSNSATPSSFFSTAHSKDLKKILNNEFFFKNVSFVIGNVEQKHTGMFW